MIDDRQRDADRAFERDLQAYRNATDRDLPQIEDTARILRSQATAGNRRSTEEGFWMGFRRMLSARPGLAIAGGVVMMVVVLGVVPVSYQRTTGHEVTMTLAASQLEEPSFSKIAKEFGHALGATQVMIEPADAPGESGMQIRARVPSRKGAELKRVANAFASALGNKGLEARVNVHPQTERVSTNLYAYAMDRVVNLNVETAGRSPAEIESDIRAQLEAAGIQNPQVQVDREGDQTNVRIQANSSDSEGEREFQVNLKSEGGDSMKAQLHRFDVERKPGMTDADVKAEIERQMREAGVEGEVTVENGEVRVKVEKHEQKQP